MSHVGIIYYAQVDSRADDLWWRPSVPLRRLAVIRTGMLARRLQLSMRVKSQDFGQFLLLNPRTVDKHNDLHDTDEWRGTITHAAN